MWKNVHNKKVEVWYFVEVVKDFVNGRLGKNKHAIKAVLHIVAQLEALIALPGVQIVETPQGVIIETDDVIHVIVFQLTATRTNSL